jgi:uncharacterized protein
MPKYTFHISGLHCKSCIVLTEGELSELSEVESAKTSLEKKIVEVIGDFGDRLIEDVVDNLNKVLTPHGYTLSLEKKEHKVKWKDFNLAIPIAIGFIIFFILLQKIGLVNLITSDTVGYGTAFLIGLIASVSTCMAVVGGLVLSMSANYAKEGDRVRPQILFHVGRLVAFFFLGGVIGALGSVFQLGALGTFVIGITVAAVLLILGINLLDIFPWMKRWQPTMPDFITGHMRELKNVNHTLTPVLIGIATFFLPCGFTQSMQFYTLSTGNFFVGAMTMFVFALGTLPVLGLLSFSSLTMHDKVKSGIFFKSIGLIVIFFGVFNLINALASYGLINPIFNF